MTMRDIVAGFAEQRGRSSRATTWWTRPGRPSAVS